MEEKDEVRTTKDEGKTLAGMTFDEMKGIASQFCDDPSRCSSHRVVHYRPGEIAATDGRILIHIDSPGIVPPADEELPTRDGILDFRPQGDGVVLARREWIAAQSALVTPAWKRAYEDFMRRQCEFDDDPRAFVRRAGSYLVDCPCCGERVVICCDELIDFEKWMDDNRPSAWYDISGNVKICVPDRKPIYVRLRYMHIALAAAECLGGADTMSLVNDQQIVFRGDGWFVVMMRLRPDGEDVYDIVATLDIKEGGAE